MKGNSSIQKIMLILLLMAMSFNASAARWVKGIYLTQYSLQNTANLKSLIRQAKAVGINTFVIDISYPSKYYQKNIKLVEDSGITYVARIVVFPLGGTHAQVINKNYWLKKYELAEYAIQMGAKEIQLDYIRYHTKHEPSSQNAKNINQVIKWFNARLDRVGIPLQVAVFGETSFSESKSIGQNVVVFADNIDVLAPMLYPSHFEPYQYYSTRPYKTVYDSLQALRNQFFGVLPFRVYAYIEVYNYRHKLSPQQRIDYIRAQIQAVRDANVNGWYAWSANNLYGPLFRALS